MIVSVAQAQSFFLALTRILAILVHVPVLGGRLVPDMVKIGLGFLLAVALIPWQPLPPGEESIPALAFTFAIGRELLVGTLAGFAATLTFAAVQMAGEMMGLVSGFGSARIINPAFESSGSALDNFFVMMAMLLFLAIDGHHAFLLALQRTFELVPLNAPLPELSAGRLVALSAQLIAAGVRLSLPVVGTLLLADLTLGLLARVAPQVHVFFLGLPLKLGAGLVVLAFALAMLFPSLVDLFRRLGERALGLLGA